MGKIHRTMKRILIFALSLLSSGAFAQATPPPDSPGVDSEYFMHRLTVEAEKIAVERKVPAAELSPTVIISCRVDTLGNITGIRYLDNTVEGSDYRDTAPVTAATREVMAEALKRVDERLLPIEHNGRKVEYELSMRLRIPVEKIAEQQSVDPLLFQGEDPDTKFPAWVQSQVHDDGHAAGSVQIRFWVEPDGRITVGKVVESPDEKLSKEIVRAIRGSRGEWTPRRVRGVPQRTAYDYRADFAKD